MNRTVKRNVRRRARRPRRGALDVFNPSANELIYTGPTRMPNRIVPETRTEQLTSFQALTSSAGGIIDTLINSGTVRTVANDFGDWDNLFSEYRVLSLRMEFCPALVGANPTTIPAAGANLPFWTVVTRDNAAAISSYSNIQNNTSLRMHPLNQKFVRESKMNSSEEASYTAVTTDPATTESYQIKIFADNLANSSVYGHLVYHWMVQFRTRV